MANEELVLEYATHVVGYSQRMPGYTLTKCLELKRQILERMKNG